MVILPWYLLITIRSSFPQLQAADDHTNKSCECLETKLRDAKDSKRAHDPFYEKLYSIVFVREAFKNRSVRRCENYWIMA